MFDAAISHANRGAPPLIRRLIFVRCSECDRRWAEGIPSIQSARQPLQISAIVCHCGAGYQHINLSIPTQES